MTQHIDSHRRKLHGGPVDGLEVDIVEGVSRALVATGQDYPFWTKYAYEPDAAGDWRYVETVYASSVEPIKRTSTTGGI
jgi:hypothetical protein